MIFTNGDKGCATGSIYNCSDMTSEDIAQIRQQEAYNVREIDMQANTSHHLIYQ